MRNILSTPKKKIAAAAAAALLIAGILLLATASAGASNTTRGIGLEKSIAVALADAGLKQEQVSNLHGYFDREDGIDAYDVSFHANGYEYEYSIKAADGAILESKIASPDGQTVTAEEALDMGLDKAKSIALSDAGVSASDAVFTRAKLDRDDGRYLYEIDFYTADSEYDYEIDAITGNIIDRDSEPLDDWDDDDWDD